MIKALLISLSVASFFSVEAFSVPSAARFKSFCRQANSENSELFLEPAHAERMFYKNAFPATIGACKFAGKSAVVIGGGVLLLPVAASALVGCCIHFSFRKLAESIADKRGIRLPECCYPDSFNVLKK